MNLIYLTVEVKSRELISKLFFIGNNIKEKFYFVIGDKLAIRRATNLFGKGVYFYKSLNKNDTNHIKRIKDKGNIYLSLDEEGGYALSNDINFLSFLKFRSSIENLKLVDRIYTWGNFDDRLWKKKYSNYSYKIKKTGAPRLDLWRKEIFNKIFSEDIEKLKRKYQSFFFIPSSFYSSKKDLMKAISNDKKLKKNQTLLPLKKRVEAKKYNYLMFKKFLNIIKNLSLDFPKEKIIIKPHPTEDINNWRSHFKSRQYKNIIIDNSFDITAYIAASKCVIFNSSTAGAQAVIMGKKAISYGDVKKDKSLRNFSNFCTSRVKNYKELKQELKKNSLNINNNHNIKFVKNRMHITKKTASKYIIDDIKNLISSIKLRNNINYSKVKFISYFYLIYDSLVSVLSIIKKILLNNNKYELSSYDKKIGSGINKFEITNVFKKLNLLTKIKIIRFSKNGYIIYKK